MLKAGKVSAVILALAYPVVEASQPAFADGPANQALRWDQAECLRTHADDYLESNTFPSLLYVGLCSEQKFAPTSSEIAEATSRNSALDPAGMPRLIAGPAIPLQPKWALLVLTKPQLLCLKSQFDKVAKPETTLLSDGTKVRVAVLDFSVCPQ